MYPYHVIAALQLEHVYLWGNLNIERVREVDSAQHSADELTFLTFDLINERARDSGNCLSNWEDGSLCTSATSPLCSTTTATPYLI